MALKMYGKWNNKEERDNDPGYKKMKEDKKARLAGKMKRHPGLKYMPVHPVHRGEKKDD